jgi:putative methyltransferase (TIGR04325 family)
MVSVVNQLQGESPDYIWKDSYPTWEDACNAAKAIGGEGLSGERWFQRITQQISDYRGEFRDYGIAMPPRPSNLPLVCAMSDPTSIVDFGGSSGWCWDYVQNSLPKNRVSSYVVVETDEVVNYMKKLGIHNSPVNYLSLKESLDACDLLYCNSVLQYFGSNASLLFLIERTTPQFILLEDLVVKGEDDFFSVQSFRGSAIPYRFLGLNKLLKELSSSGYKELVRYPYASPVLGVIKPLQMGNFPEAKQLRYSQSILLKKFEEQ